MTSTPGSRRPPAVGNGKPLQCSCLENHRDSGAWWAAFYGVEQSRTRLKRLSSSNSYVNCSKSIFPRVDGGGFGIIPLIILNLLSSLPLRHQLALYWIIFDYIFHFFQILKSLCLSLFIHCDCPMSFLHGINLISSALL